MKSLHVRGIDKSVLDRLRRLAQLHHRSLQGELRAILEQAALRVPETEPGEDLELITVAAGSPTNWSRDEIYSDDAR